MSRTIDAALKAKLLLMQQTVYNNANLYTDVKVLRPKTPLSYKQYLLETEVAPVSSTCTSTAIRRISFIRPPDYAYVAYVTGTTLYVKRARLTYPLTSMSWEFITSIESCSQCSLSFDGSFVYNGDKIEFLTDTIPWLFYTTTTGELKAGLIGGEYETLVGSNVTNIDSIRGVASLYKDIDQGLVCFYVIAGNVYYNSFIAGVWEGQQQVTLAPANTTSIKAERTFDWRIILQVTDNTGALYEIFTKMEASGWNGTDHLVVTNAELVIQTYKVNYIDWQSDNEAITFTPELAALLCSINSPQMLDAANLADGEGDYGFWVRLHLDEQVFGAEDNAAAFKLTDSYSMQWYGQEVIKDGYYLLIRFTDFNNASNPITLSYTPGTMSSGVVDVEADSIQFDATGLVPTYVPPPVPTGIYQLEEWEEWQ